MLIINNWLLYFFINLFYRLFLLDFITTIIIEVVVNLDNPFLLFLRILSIYPLFNFSIDLDCFNNSRFLGPHPTFSLGCLDNEVAKTLHYLLWRAQKQFLWGLLDNCYPGAHFYRFIYFLNVMKQ